MTKIVGDSIQRSKVFDKVTGSQQYNGDRELPGMLHAKLLRSSCARARIIDIDIKEASEMEGVVLVLTGKSIPAPVPRFGSILNDQPILAVDDVKYHGEPVAVVVALDEKTASLAVSKIKVSYEELPAVVTIEDALAKDAPVVNPDYEKDKTGQVHHNVYNEYKYNWGNVDDVKDKCAKVINRVYEFPMVYHFPIERFSCIVAPDDNSGVTIWTPIQHPFIMRRVISSSLSIPLSKIRVIAEEIGGGFGGKGYPKIEPLATYLALKLNKPIKMQLDFEEGFYSSRRLSNKTNITTGFDEEGHIIFQDIETDFLIGSYADAAPRIAQKSSYLACGPYRTPNARIVCKAINSNTTPSTAFRGFGMPQLIWALESQINEASRILEIDALEIRKRNIPKKGEVLVPGDTPVDGEWLQGLEKAAELIGWGNKNSKNQGKGIAIGIKNPIPGSASNSIVRLHEDGSATVSVGTTEMGQGSRTVMGQVAAEVLKIPYNKVSVIMGDTGVAPFDQATAGSRSTVSMGKAVERACLNVNEQLTELVAEKLNVAKDDIELSNGLITIPNGTMSYSDFLSKYIGPTQADIIGKGKYEGKKVPENPLGGTADFWEIIFTAVDLSIDEETGKVDIAKVVNVSDVGKVINPLQAEGQEEGGSVMAMGHTLMESLIYSDKGLLLNSDPLNYTVPTSKDAPRKFESFFIENGDGPGPFGSKGLGESSMIPFSAAVGGAIYDAIGIAFNKLPITSEKLYFAIKEKKQSV